MACYKGKIGANMLFFHSIDQMLPFLLMDESEAKSQLQLPFVKFVF